MVAIHRGVSEIGGWLFGLVIGCGGTEMELLLSISEALSIFWDVVELL